MAAEDTELRQAASKSTGKSKREATPTPLFGESRDKPSTFRPIGVDDDDGSRPTCRSAPLLSRMSMVTSTQRLPRPQTAMAGRFDGLNELTTDSTGGTGADDGPKPMEMG